MRTKQTEAESFLKAFRALPKSQQTAVVERLVQDNAFGADLEDIALIERARREKGKDVPLDAFVRARMKNGRSIKNHSTAETAEERGVGFFSPHSQRPPQLNKLL